MGLWSFFRDIFYDRIRFFFFSNVFICLNLDHETLQVYIERLKRKKVLDVTNKAYPVKDGLIPIKVLKNAREYLQLYPFCYLCGMSKSTDQGMCKKEELEKHLAGVRKKDVVLLEVDQYYFFILKHSLKQDLDRFNSVMPYIDYIFSPFLILYACIKPTLENNVAIYGLLEHSRLCVMVSNHKEICYSKWYALEIIKEHLEVQGKEKEEEYEKEEALLKSFLSSIEANLMHIDPNFQDGSQKESATPDMQDPKSLVDSMVHVADIVKFLQESMKVVYDHHLVKDFIEKVWILNTYQISPKMLEILQDELMLDIVQMPISLVEQMSILAKKEYYHEVQL
ncbi:hypothetical protein [Helicobacter bizzozeronii]|uniref:hypothetical protein n=1 Tax=Helicobacter bizzozeronii TaxID=56877 RepID=UPI000CEED8E6|nr:hypothetical protein [Helicobacter bizzozeronii]